jgi:peptidoglycan/xylan/chitin deacetylase (PgdA/CDA1 family)
VEDFLVALEAHSGAPRLSRRAGWFAKHLMNRHAKDPDLTRRAGTVMAHLILEIHNLTHRAYESGQFLKRSILVALLMMPKVKRHLQKIKSFLQINEKVKISSENVTLQAHYLTLEDSPSCLNAPNIVKIVKPGPSHQKVVAQSLGNTMDKIPILRYCHVGPASSKNLGNSQVTPKAFEDQLRYMREAGYQGIGLEEWRNAVYKKIPLESQSVLLTFDDGCRDFLTYAWPLLKHYGFTATVFLITSQIGQSKIWDQICGDEISLLSWKEIRQLQSEGVTFGSRSVSHPDLTSLPLKEALREIRQSRIILQSELGIHISSFAYPYGKFNRVIEYLVGVRGYDFGLSCEPGLCTVNHSFLALPRIELKGSDSLEKFVAKLGSLPPSKKGLEMSSVTNFT